MNPARIILAAALLTSGFALYAKPVEHGGAPSGAELVAARQAGMDMSGSTLTCSKTPAPMASRLKT